MAAIGLDSSGRSGADEDCDGKDGDEGEEEEEAFTWCLHFCCLPRWAFWSGWGS